MGLRSLGRDGCKSRLFFLPRHRVLHRESFFYCSCTVRHAVRNEMFCSTGFSDCRLENGPPTQIKLLKIRSRAPGDPQAVHPLDNAGEADSSILRSANQMLINHVARSLKNTGHRAYGTPGTNAQRCPWKRCKWLSAGEVLVRVVCRSFVCSGDGLRPYLSCQFFLLVALIF